MSSFFKETHHTSDCSVIENIAGSWIIFHWRHQVVNNIITPGPKIRG